MISLIKPKSLYNVLHSMGVKMSQKFYKFITALSTPCEQDNINLIPQSAGRAHTSHIESVTSQQRTLQGLSSLGLLGPIGSFHLGLGSASI